MSNYSTNNSLKVFVSPYSTPSTQLTVDALTVGEIGFYNAADAIATSGDGYFVWKKSDSTIKRSCLITSFVGWTSATTVYSAPTLRTVTVTVPTNTVGQVYQLRLMMRLVGMEGEYFKHGNYMCVTGNSTTDIATGLTTSINAALLREGKEDYFTITSSSAIITIVSTLQPYVKGKKLGDQVQFEASLSLPYIDGVAGTQTQAGSMGVGHGPHIAEQEMFAQGDSDAFRFDGWPNSFDWNALETSSTGTYDVVAISQDNLVQSQMDQVYAPQEYLICFDQSVLSVETDITAFTLLAQDAPAVINTTTHAITIDVAVGTVVTALIPTYALSPGATISPLSGVADDFTSAVTATVTAEDGVTTQAWTVTVTVLT